MNVPPIQLHHLRECFASTDGIAFQWLDELDRGPMRLEQIPGIVLLWLSLVTRLDQLTSREQLRVYEDPQFCMPVAMGGWPPYKLTYTPSVHIALVTWLRLWMVGTLEDAFGFVMAEASENDAILKRLQHVYAVYLYVLTRYSQYCDTAVMTGELAQGAILLQCLKALSGKLDGTGLVSQRPRLVYAAWRFTEWSLAALPGLAVIPLPSQIHVKLQGLYYELLGKLYSAEGTLTDAWWAYRKAFSHDKRYEPELQEIASRLKAAGIQPLTKTQEPDAKVREGLERFDIKPCEMNVRAAISKYLSIDGMVLPLDEHWFGAEFRGLHSAPGVLRSTRSLKRGDVVPFMNEPTFAADSEFP